MCKRCFIFYEEIGKQPSGIFNCEMHVRPMVKVNESNYRETILILRF